MTIGLLLGLATAGFAGLVFGYIAGYRDGAQDECERWKKLGKQ